MVAKVWKCQVRSRNFEHAENLARKSDSLDMTRGPQSFFVRRVLSNLREILYRIMFQ